MEYLCAALIVIPLLLVAVGYLLIIVGGVERVTRIAAIRDDAVEIYGFDRGEPVKFYLCAKCESYALSETDDSRVLRCAKCGRLYSLKEYDVLISGKGYYD